ncbi:MAG: hypothetical protein JXA14_08145 [Anaerolineae bacterium]|nr:hypothetical protein [Anaerolineae bacterium]
MQDTEQFQERFRAWLGSNPEHGARIVAKRSGYSLDYVRWIAGLIGHKPWPGSRRFMRRMAALGCSDKPWRDRSPEEVAYALREREVLVEGKRRARRWR